MVQPATLSDWQQEGQKRQSDQRDECAGEHLDDLTQQPTENIIWTAGASTCSLTSPCLRPHCCDYHPSAKSINRCTKHIFNHRFLQLCNDYHKVTNLTLHGLHVSSSRSQPNNISTIFIMRLLTVLLHKDIIMKLYNFSTTPTLKKL